MPIYQDVFGAATIYPSEISYSSLTLTADVVLSWPQETSANANLATRIMDIQASTSAYFIYLPEANKTGTGQTILFNNKGTATIIVKNSAGVQVVSLASGTSWQVYLTDNSTAAGTWNVLQYGASTSQANASSLAGTGIVAVGTLLSQSMPITSFNTNYTAGVADRAVMFLWTGAGGTLTLPLPTDVGANWFCYLRNAGTGTIVADPSGTILIDGSSILNFQPGESAIIATDGSSYYTIGYGQSAVFAFDFTVINVAGSGTYTLSGTELNRVAYRFTGALTGNRQIIVPSTVQQYWVDNQTTGAYTFQVKTASYSGITVNQSARAILYCDGTSVVNADTATLSFPIAVSQGGTGATNAAAALINLSGTPTGIGVFTAATQAAAVSALGASAVGSNLFLAASQAAAYAALGVAPSGVVDGGTF